MCVGGGDFTVLRFLCEKRDGTRVTISMRKFDTCIRECDLIDVPIVNALFTWSVSGGRNAAFRLDHFLCSRQWSEEFLDLSLSLGPRLVSDHFPLILESAPITWGPTPFRFENMWLLHQDFKRNIQEWWEEHSEFGWAGYCLMKKLKFVKEKLKIWNREVFGDVRIRKRELLELIGGLDRLECDEGGSAETSNQRVALMKESEEINLKERRSMNQKIKFKWTTEGDVNSKLFFKVANGRKKRNFIKELEDEGGNVLRDHEEIERTISSFYENLFSEEVLDRLILDGLDWYPILEDQARWLERPFEVVEIKKVVFDLEGDKASGPDGFSLSFFQECWETIMDDLLLVF